MRARTPHDATRTLTAPRRPLRRIAAAALLALVPALLSAGPATAAEAPDCEGQQLSQPFLRFLDPALYTPVPDGGLEAAARGWDLREGAAVVAGNESYHVAGADDARSLSLPAGSSATSPPICVSLLHPTVRLFARNGGSPLSTLAVEALVSDGSGLLERVPVGVVLGGLAWQPTLPLPVLANLTAPLAADGNVSVRFRFTPTGALGRWQIDDVFVDPYKVT